MLIIPRKLEVIEFHNSVIALRKVTPTDVMKKIHENIIDLIMWELSQNPIYWPWQDKIKEAERAGLAFNHITQTLLSVVNSTPDQSSKMEDGIKIEREFVILVTKIEKDEEGQWGKYYHSNEYSKDLQELKKIIVKTGVPRDHLDFIEAQQSPNIKSIFVTDNKMLEYFNHLVIRATHGSN